MQLIPGSGGIELGLGLWRRTRPGAEAPVTKWFVCSFINAATVVIDRWGPSWSKRRIGSAAAVGAWALFVLWLGLPLLLVSWLW
jgi:hypothetical protein